jgi:hypothetical protein
MCFRIIQKSGIGSPPKAGQSLPCFPDYPLGPLRETAMKKKKRFPEVESFTDEIKTPVDLFDALPPHIQKNHKLLKAFCQWYLFSKDHDLSTSKKDKRLSRSPSYYFKNAIYEMALKLHKKDTSLKAPAILKHPDMQALIADSEAVGSPDTWIRWIQNIIKMKKERGWDKSP